MNNINELIENLKYIDPKFSKELKDDMEIGIIRPTNNYKLNIVADILASMDYKEDLPNLLNIINNYSPNIDLIRKIVNDMIITSVDNIYDNYLSIVEHQISDKFTDPNNIDIIKDEVLIKSDNLIPPIIKIKYYVDGKKRFTEGKSITRQPLINNNSKSSFYMLVKKSYFENKYSTNHKFQLYFIYHQE